MSEILVSICVPIYGVEKYIERCSVSLFEQTYGNIEFIFVDDCCKDNSINILKSVIERYPNRKELCKIIRHENNKGLGTARNTAISYACGEFIVHVDSDDYVDRCFIEMLVEEQKMTDSDIVSCSFRKLMKTSMSDFDFNKISSPKDLNLAVIKHDVPNNIWGRLIRRSLYVDNNIRVTDGVNMSEDLNVLPRLLYYSKLISSVPNVLYFYDCTNSSSYTASFSEEKSNQGLKTIEQLDLFFKDRPSCFIDALYVRRLKNVSMYMKSCAKEDGHKEYYNFLKNKISYIDNKYYKYLDIPTRFSLFISSYPLFCFFVRFCVFFKKLL